MLHGTVFSFWSHQSRVPVTGSGLFAIVSFVCFFSHPKMLYSHHFSWSAILTQDTYCSS